MRGSGEPLHSGYLSCELSYLAGRSPEAAVQNVLNRPAEPFELSLMTLQSPFGCRKLQVMTGEAGLVIAQILDSGRQFTLQVRALRLQFRDSSIPEAKLSDLKTPVPG